MSKDTYLGNNGIKGDGVIMIGSGLIANLNDQQIELIKHAKTTYQTQKNDK